MINFNRLVLTNFKGIESADVEFSNGLNVLYGANELGKSSLLTAIRAVLFLPVTSAEANTYITWGTTFQPAVTLDFTIGDVKYQVHKRFGVGARGIAELYRFKGTERLSVATKKKVDQELQRLIEWGMPLLGKRGSPRGVPQSYLSNALLGDQDEVELVLTTNIAEDKSTSGLEVLTKALGTIGRDPLVGELLEHLDDSTSKVFTPTGQFKRTADSPLAIKTRDTDHAEVQLRQLTSDLRESRDVEKNIEHFSVAANTALQEMKRMQEIVELVEKAVAADKLLNITDSTQNEIHSAQTEHNENQKVLDANQAEAQQANDSLAKLEGEIAKGETELARGQQEYKSLDEVTAADFAVQRSELLAKQTEIKRQQSIAALNTEYKSLVKQSADALQDCKFAEEKFLQAEKQVRLSLSISEKQELITKVAALEEMRKAHRSLEVSLGDTESEQSALKIRLDRCEELSVLRRELNKEISKNSDLNQALQMQTEAQRLYDDKARMLEKLDIETHELRAQSQESHRQLAALGGQRQTLLRSASSVIQSKRQLLQSTINTSKQRIDLAESALEVQQDIDDLKQQIVGIEKRLTASRRNLDDAVSGLRRHESEPRSRGNNQNHANAKRSIPVVTIASTVIATVALAGGWLSEVLPIGVIAAPVVSVFGFGVAYLQWRRTPKNTDGVRNNRSVEYRSDSARDQFGSRTDDFRRDGDRLARAESELRFLHGRHHDLIEQLGEDAVAALAQEQQRIEVESQELAHLDAGNVQEVHDIEQEILSVEQQISSQHQPIELLQSQRKKMAAELESAQKDIAKLGARREHLATGGVANIADIENEFNELAGLLKAESDTDIDSMTVDWVEAYKSKVRNQLQDKEAELKSMQLVLADSKAELRLEELNDPVRRLKTVDTEIAQYGEHKPIGNGSMLLIDAIECRDGAQLKLDAAKVKLSNINGHLEAKQKDLSNISNNNKSPSDASLASLSAQLDEIEAKLNVTDVQNPQEKINLKRHIDDLEVLLKDKRILLNKEKERAHALGIILKELRGKAGQLQGKLTQLETQLDDTARNTAQRCIDQAIADSGGEINSQTPLLDQLEGLQVKLDMASKRSADSQKQLNQSRGQLKLIGGKVLADQVQRQQEMVTRLKTDANEFERKCEAEKYLLDVMSEENEQHSVHLGRVLAAPVSKKFAELTVGRYGEFSLDPSLTIKGVRVVGESRDYKQLSIGTRQQLAVLVKLSLAAQLNACLVLDDQLVQSDVDRLSWFVGALRNSVQEFNHQIIVITCRPDDYGAPFHGQGVDSAIDLTAKMKRTALS